MVRLEATSSFDKQLEEVTRLRKFSLCCDVAEFEVGKVAGVPAKGKEPMRDLPTLEQPLFSGFRTTFDASFQRHTSLKPFLVSARIRSLQ